MKFNNKSNIEGQIEIEKSIKKDRKKLKLTRQTLDPIHELGITS